MNSSKITSELTALQYDIIKDNLKKPKTEINKSIEGNHKNVIERSTTEMNDKEKRLVDISTQTGVSNWLTVLPITEFGFELSKQQFWDSIRFRYCWEISSLPTSCPYGSKFDIQHILSCKKVAFIYIRHNDLREQFKRDKGRHQDSRFLGTRATGICRIFRVFDPNACRYRNKSLQQCHVMNEQEKKRAYYERILQIEHGTFLHLWCFQSTVVLEEGAKSFTHAWHN